MIFVIPLQVLENVFSIFCNQKNVKRMLHQKMSFHGKMEKRNHQLEGVEAEKENS